MFITVNNITLFYEKTGKGKPMILVHGNGEDHTIFNEAIRVLRNHYTCYAIDSRGHGLSDRVDEYHYEDMAKDVLAFIQELKLKEVTYYGFSDGGIIGLLAAQQYRFKQLIVSGANIRPDGVKWFVRTFMKITNKFKHNPKVDLMLNEPNITHEQLNRISCKTLVLAGSSDLIKTKHTQEIAANIRKAQLMIIDGEGHGSYIVHSDKIATIILTYKS